MNLKKIIVLLLSLFILVGFSGCDNENGKVSEVDSTGTATKEEEKVPINPDDIVAIINIKEPDSAGFVYMDATFKNNTDYPITSYELTVLLKDTNEKTYLSTNDTVMPGETSPIFESFGPKTLNPNDYELLRLIVGAKKDNGETLNFEYDFKLQEASWN